MDSRIIAIGGTVLGLAAGSVGGYLFAKKQLEQKYVELAEKEIAQAREYYSVLYKRGDYATPAGALQRRVPSAPEGVDDRIHEGPDTEVLEKVLAGLKYHTTNQPATNETRAKIAHALSGGEPSDYEAEDASRSADRPYVLDVNEFMNTEVGYTQLTLTYFAEDNVLAGEDDEAIPDIEGWIGMFNLNKFGHRSGDEKTVYIRNERLERDFEVIHDGGSYAEMVHGIVQEKTNRNARR